MSDEEEEEVPATREEKIAISKYFIMDAPPGHVNTVVAALKKLNCNDVLDEELKKKLLTQYYIKNNCSVLLPNDLGQFVTCAEGFDEATQKFKDPASKHIVELDFEKGVGSAANLMEDSQFGDCNQDIRKALQDAVDKYVLNNFLGGSGAVFGKGDEYTIYLSVEKKKLSAFWSGRWASKYTVKVNGGGADMEGTLTVLCHYFEEGNVQLRSTKKADKRHIDFTDNKDLGAALITMVEDVSKAAHNELGYLFETMEATTFKAIRRQLPINGRKFAWKDYKTYELATARNRVAERMEEAKQG